MKKLPKETKIGLLVGISFIIIFSIILSERRPPELQVNPQSAIRNTRGAP